MSYTFANFIVGPSNQVAHTAAMTMVKTSGTVYNPVVIYGGRGLGKTHLLQAIQAEIEQHAPTRQVFYLPATRLRVALAQGRLLSCDVLLIDDLHFLLEREHGQDMFLRTFHMLEEAGKQVIVSLDQSPQTLTTTESRLRSRLASGLTAEIQLPELATRLAILHARSLDRGISLSHEVAMILADAVPHNIRELENCLARLMAYASLRARRIDVDLAQTVLQQRERDSRPPLTIERIQQAVAKRFGVTIRQLQSKKRHRTVVLPRQVAMFLCHVMTKTAFPEIGRHFGGRQASTVSHACEKVTHMQESSEEIAQLLWELRHDLQD